MPPDVLQTYYTYVRSLTKLLRYLVFRRSYVLTCTYNTYNKYIHTYDTCVRTARERAWKNGKMFGTPTWVPVFVHQRLAYTT